PPAPAPAPTRTRAVEMHAYEKPAREKPDNGTSLVTFTLLLTAPAVLAAAALRPRSRSGARGGRRG
ncbi:hypothetical protein, partial [Streptomyces sp. MK37H]|uniref:hypothetical protein n=1 Tax=Streptomyces sp. MK37H TaxID=2699117 RepID=UPI001B36824F